MIRQHATPMPRPGFVTAVDVTNAAVTVSMGDGTVTSSLGWATAYTPAVGDRVLVVPTTAGWFVLGKVNAIPSVIADQQAVVPLAHDWQGILSDPDTQGAGWRWGDYLAGGDPTADMWQGRVPPQHGSPGYVQTSWDIRATVAHWGSLAALVPSGSVIQQVTVTLRGQWVQQTLAAPVLYAHAYTPASPPVSTVWNGDGSAVITPGPPPAWVYGPVRFPRVGAGETTVITVPAAWVTAWLAGTITGLGLYSTTNADGVNFGDDWHTSADGMTTIWDTDYNGDLTITYTPPAGS
jgi:hypothetical protein